MLLSLKLSAQSYNFSNYNLKEGLPQSQVNVIYQAENRTLWLGTFGGVSNFDGKNFTSYSKAEGLLSNSITSIVEDNQHQILLGTEAGINVLKSGKISILLKSKEILSLTKDAKGQIWGICDWKLFKLKNGKQIFITINSKSITSLNTDRLGNLYAISYGDGVYKLSNDTWKLYKKLPPILSQSNITKILFDYKNANKIYYLSRKQGVFESEADHFNLLFSKPTTSGYYALEQDKKGGIWIGTERGAYLINKQNTLYFNADNGLTDNRIYQIFNDAEENIWVSSSSDGMFKYEGDAYIRYNKFKDQNIAYPISGLAADKNENLWIGTFNKGLLKYNGNNIETINNPAFSHKNIFFVYPDKAKNIWVSAQDNGLWKFDGQEFSQVLKTENHGNFTSMADDGNGGLWISTPMKCIYLKSGKTKIISGFDGYSSVLFAYTKDSVFLSTSTGVYLIKNQQIDKTFKINALSGVFVMGIIKHGNNLLFGTLGDGIVSWNPNTKEIKKYVTSNGLNSNDIYSLTVDDKNNLWAGTGRGINKLKFNAKTKSYEVFRNNPLIIECNQNAIVNYKGNILVGTVSGLIRCKINATSDVGKSPLVHIVRANVYHKSDNAKDTSFYLAEGAIKNQELAYSQNHISLSYRAVFLTNPQAVTYRYKLNGTDNDFGKPVSNTEVEYSALRPGNYTFQVMAIANGQKSNIATFSFTIVPPFYDTVWFKTLAFLCIIFLIWIIFYFIFKTRERKKFELEKIKLSEQEKIRKQTAEDFHDDIGNKLTRINVLSEILDKKVDHEQGEQKELIRLIKENAGLLYTGTKDILWALDPQSDNLFEILMHIKNFGIDLFQNTGVDFKMEGILSEYQKLHLSMEFNRNLTLIFKEMLNNVLKHANAKQVLIMIIKSEQNTIDILTTDDGKGFDLDTVERGHGLKNIQTRCKRIKSTFKIASVKGKGTTTTISTRIPVTI